MRLGGNTGLLHKLQIIFTGMVQTVDAQPHWRLLIIGINDLLPLCRISQFDAFKQPARVQIAAFVIGCTCQQFFLLALELAQYTVNQSFQLWALQGDRAFNRFG
ncbi:hypothetical protein D3C80_1360450 [compost metagenome]